jgi:DNA-binding response OmpR family regulator
MKQVLIVEDDLLVADVYSQKLRLEGLGVNIAPDGKAGLVAFPTEIIYGLGTHTRDPQAVRENLRRQGTPHLGPAHRSRPRVRSRNSSLLNSVS